jgi:hypothetical protein
VKIKKGDVVIYISPSDYSKYKLAGWKRCDERTREAIKNNNEKAKLRRIEKLEKGGSE